MPPEKIKPNKFIGSAIISVDISAAAFNHCSLLSMVEDSRRSLKYLPAAFTSGGASSSIEALIPAEPIRYTSSLKVSTISSVPNQEPVSRTLFQPVVFLAK